MTGAIFQTDLPGLLHRGKVRDTYDLGGGLLLMVATDRISAFDVVLPTPVPGKGAVLAQMSAFWFGLTRHVMPNHLAGMAYDRPAIAQVPRTGALADLTPELEIRSAVVRRAQRIDMECVVRAYLTGSGWAEYRSLGTLNGAPLPKGLRQADRLPELMFTPSTKAETGHDLPLTRLAGESLVGKDLYARLEQATLAVFRAAHDHARSKGMIIADTKMEFGFIGGELTLIDELLTPDSSRFWDEKDWKPGAAPPSYDKQFVRDWLIKSGWNKEPPAPALPSDIIERTRERYVQAFSRLTGGQLML
jgi:phosphoribosylaminoimidazole-succinocarboxamide synthase